MSKIARITKNTAEKYMDTAAVMEEVTAMWTQDFGCEEAVLVAAPFKTYNLVLNGEGTEISYAFYKAGEEVIFDATHVMED